MGHEWAYIRLFQTTFEKLERIQGLKRLVYAWEFFLYRGSTLQMEASAQVSIRRYVLIEFVCEAITHQHK